MLLDPVMVKIIVGLLDAFCWIKNTKIDFGRGFAPVPTGLAYTAPPDLLVGGQLPPSQEPHPRLGSSALRAASFGPLGFVHSVPPHF